MKVYVILTHNYNYSQVHKIFKDKATAEAYKLYFDRNSFEHCTIEESYIDEEYIENI